MTPGRRQRAAAVLVSVFVAAGCSSGHAQTGAPQALESSAGLASAPSSRAPQVIASAGAPAPASGVDGWAAALTTASATASLDPLRRWATPTCPCLAGVATSLAALSSAHQHLTVRYRVTSATLIARSGADADVSAELAWGTYDVLTARGVVAQTEPAGRQTARYSLHEEGDRWLVAVIS